jgi:hypothetical protein
MKDPHCLPPKPPKPPKPPVDPLADVKLMLAETLTILKKPKPIEIVLNIDVLNQILGIVKDIRHHQASDSVTKAEIDEILGPVLARMKAVP